MELLQTDLNYLRNSFKKYRISIDGEYVCQEIVKDLPEKLQYFLKKSNKINPFSHNTLDSYSAKELYRQQSVLERSGRKYQRKKR